MISPHSMCLFSPKLMRVNIFILTYKPDAIHIATIQLYYYNRILEISQITNITNLIFYTESTNILFTLWAIIRGFNTIIREYH
jgi:hypothetical protein